MDIPQYVTNGYIVSASIAISLMTAFGVFYYNKKHINGQQVPHKWKEVGKVKDIIMYPLKSGRRMPVDRAICTEVGLQLPECGAVYQLRDRNFVIYREDNLTYESSPKILQIRLSVTKDNQVILEAPGIEEFKLTEVAKLADSQIKTIILLYSEKISVRDCGDEASKWVSKYVLGTDTGLRLGFNDNSHRRNIEIPYKKHFDVYPQLSNSASGLYSNMTSYMLLTQASVDDLSSKIPDQNITVNNFRPNIVVEGTKPYAEENWKWVKVGNVILYMVKYCVRCQFVTVDPETSVRNSNYEPLKTMKRYRQLKQLKNIDYEGDRCVMGINMALNKGGEIQVGDTVYVGN